MVFVYVAITEGDIGLRLSAQRQRESRECRASGVVDDSDSGVYVHSCDMPALIKLSASFQSNQRLPAGMPDHDKQWRLLDLAMTALQRQRRRAGWLIPA